jgi:hypothetical protein
LPQIITLPLYQIEQLTKRIEQIEKEGVFQLNEIWPKVSDAFIKTYGLNPSLRDPVNTLLEFFLNFISRDSYGLPVKDSRMVQALADVLTKKDEDGLVLPKYSERPPKGVDKLSKTQTFAEARKVGKVSGTQKNYSRTELAKILSEYEVGPTQEPPQKSPRMKKQRKKMLYETDDESQATAPIPF